jgi:hypothetical protein
MKSRTSAATAGVCGFCFESSGIQYTTDGLQFRLANDPSPIFPPVIGIQGGSSIPGAPRPSYGFVGQFGTDYAVAYTLDAGLTWQRSQIAYTASWARYLSMPTANVWYVTCGFWGQSSTSTSRPLFEKLDIVPVNGTDMELKINLEALKESSHSRKVLQSGRYRTAILKTGDAGRSWTTVFEDLSSDFYLNNIYCTSENVCITVGDGEGGVALRTVDGGRTWRRILDVPGRNIQIMDVKMVSAREGFIAGASLSQTQFIGYMYFTQDGGDNWQRQEVPEVAPVSISLYRSAGGIGGHGTALTPDGQSSTIVYR